MPEKIYLFIIVSNIINNKKLAKPCEPKRCKMTPEMIAVQNHHFLNINFFSSSNSLPSGFMKLTANTGLKIKATIREAANVKINIVGR